MPPKKKKTKPASNPARGFATTSIASKPKPDRISNGTSADQSTAATPAETPAVVAEQESKGAAPQAQGNSTRELHELNPEELEAQLDLQDLQNVIDQYGPKVRKESSRQVARLQTDRRILRSQADFLNVREWLPDDLTQQIIDLAMEEDQANTANASVSQLLKRYNEDDLLSRIWQLNLTLSDLDIPEDQVRNVLQYILTNPPTEETNNLIWGLSECLDWLALHSDASQLLDYDTQKVKPQSMLETSLDADSASPESEQTPRTSGQQTPVYQPAPPEIAPVPVADDIEVSDAESDMDPDEMLSTYLRTKARLFDRNPDLVSDPPSGGKKSKNQRGKPSAIAVRPTPGEARLQQKLKSIEADVLFDRRAADFQWAGQKAELLQDRAERRRLQLDEERKEKQAPNPGSDAKAANGPANASDDVMAEAEAEAQKMLEEMGAEEDGLGAMFGEPADSGDSGKPAAAESSNVMIRNFGKISGITPRRVFEEACRSKDSGAKVHMKLVSPTTYSARHSITVSWTKDQEPLDTTSVPDVTVQQTMRKTIITAANVACPDTAQSEGYVSTAALFLLFSSSPKEERAALRLPPAFRDLWTEFLNARQEKRDVADREVVKSLRDMVRQQTEKEVEDDEVILTAGFRKRAEGRSGVSTPVDNGLADGKIRSQDSQALRDMWARKTSTPSYQHMLVNRMQLPMFQFRDEALAAVEHNQIVILCGETGCGKSTQMPAFIMEHELSQGRSCKIYCTEPRRISAISLAQRVSEELGEGKGAVGTSRSLVGYAIRLESHTTAQTRLVYATVGIVLRMLESAKGIDEVTHLVIDEIHERSIDTDFLLIVLRSLLVRRPDLKVVLMSATVDAQRFSNYLDNAPIVSVPGRTFPVQAKFLEDAIELTGHTIEDDSYKARQNENDDEDVDRPSEGSGTAGQELVGYKPKTIRTLANYDEYIIDYSLIIKLLEQVAYNNAYTPFSKAILIFLPGIAEIRQLNDALTGHPSFAQGWLVYPLHSSFSSEDQQAAFNIPPPGMRKIVLATNIAETGITIPDVTCVIDTGKHKEMRFDERRQLSRLIQSFISRANAKQRRGRAGRVQEGLAFHLFTKHRHDNLMAEQQTPEMLRLSLQDLVMRVKICRLGDIEQALSQALDPPSLKNIRRAIDALIDVGALTQSEELTPLGQQLAKLPLDAQLGKLIILASMFGVLDFGLTTAAILSSKSPFLSPMNAKKAADTVRLGFKRGNSDLLTAYNAYLAWRKTCQTPGASEFQFCRKTFLSPQNLATIEDLKSQLLASLADAGFVALDGPARSALSRVRNSGGSRGTRSFVAVPAANTMAENNDVLAAAVVAWSFYPKFLVRDGKGWRHVGSNQSISLHPTSVNRNNNNNNNSSASSAMTAPAGASASASASAGTLTPTPLALDPSSTRLLSFYSILQTAGRATNAQETTPVDAFAALLLVGDARFDVYAGVVVVDGNRLRFKVSGCRAMMALKVLRARAREVLGRGLKAPGRRGGERSERWMGVLGEVFARVGGGVERR